MLTLPEELLLLSLNDDKGTVVQSGALALPYGLAGAVIMELVLQGKIEVESAGSVIHALDTATTGNPLLDEALRHVQEGPAGATVQYWIQRPEELVADIKQRLLDQLVAKEILKKEEHRILWIFPSARYPTGDASPEQEIRQRLQAVLFEDAEPDERTALLLGLVDACHLAHEVFPESAVKEVLERLHTFAESDRIAKAVSSHVMAVTMALVTSSISASVTSYSFNNPSY